MIISLKNNSNHEIFNVNPVEDFRYQPLMDIVNQLKLYKHFEKSTDIEVEFDFIKGRMLVKKNETYSTTELENTIEYGVIREVLTQIPSHSLFHKNKESFSSLITTDDGTLKKIILACDGQLEKFKLLFSVFKNEPQFALPIANLIGKKEKYVEYNYSKLYEYLSHPLVSDELKREYTPNLLNWLEKTTPEELKTLLTLCEKNLISLNFDIDENQGIRISFFHMLEDFFNLPIQDITQAIERCQKYPEKEKKFLKIIIEICKGKAKDSLQERLDLADRLMEMKYESYSSYRALLKKGLDPLEFSGQDAQSCMGWDIPIEGKDKKHYVAALKASGSEEWFEFHLSLPKEACFALVSNVVNDQWINYVVRRPGWEKVYQNSRQDIYGSMMHSAIQLGMEGIKEKKWDFSLLLDFFAKMRRGMGYHLNHPDFKDIGLPRGTSSHRDVTFCAGKHAYEDLGNKLWIQKESLPKGNLEMNRSLAIENGKLQFSQVINNEEIDLTSVTFPEGFPDVEKNISQDYCVVINHTPQKNISKIMEYVEKTLYPSALSEDDPTQLLEKLGQIYWWICQAKPWELGDPSIAEMLIRSILELKGLKSYPWRADIVPWEEVALEKDPKVFAKKFASLFDYSAV